MRLARPFVYVACVCTALLAWAQSPVVSQSVPTQNLVAGGSTVTLDLRNFFAVPGVSGQVVQFDTVMGRFNVEMRADAAPRHVTNFLGYVSRGDYTNTFVHRSATFDNGPISIVQGGGYRVVGNSVAQVAEQPAIALEYNLPNARGTVAAARKSDPNSAANEWFINTRDNSAILGPTPTNGGGYSVFGRVIGDGMTVVDAIAQLRRVDATGGDPSSPFGELPVRNFSSGTLTETNLVVVSSVKRASLFPVGNDTTLPSVVTFSVQSSAPNRVEAQLSGSSLNLVPVAAGNATITVRAVDTHNATAETSFAVTVTAVAPAFLRQPVSQTVAAGSTVVLNATATNAPSYRWQFNGVDIDGATSSALVINNASGVHNGSYRVIASNVAGSVTSETASITVANVPASEAGRLVNLSILTPGGAGSRVLTVGAVVGPLNGGGSLPLVVRGVGPGLAVVGVNSGFLPDPQMSLFGAGGATLATNDDWGGTAELSAAFAAVGAFALPANSRDSAIFRPAPGVNTGNYTVQVSGKADATGLVLAEIYDALGDARTATSPRLINVSVLKVLDPGSSLTAGFVLRGETARTVLIRAIGPGLAALGVGGVMSDPQLELFNASSVPIAENDNWGGENFLRNAGTSVGAFAVQNSASRDAMLLTTLSPGNYTARVSGVSGASGNVIVEVYEVP